VLEAAHQFVEGVDRQVSHAARAIKAADPAVRSAAAKTLRQLSALTKNLGGEFEMAGPVLLGASTLASGVHNLSEGRSVVDSVGRTATETAGSLAASGAVLSGCAMLALAPPAAAGCAGLVVTAGLAGSHAGEWTWDHKEKVLEVVATGAAELNENALPAALPPVWQFQLPAVLFGP
jgi:hypothetical protein